MLIGISIFEELIWI